ncbi:hypothetical protein [Corynebacterium ammoniagenes]|uniref:Asparagine synthetase domain-containing protein n=1 Tax=Corynebacterium ammoniagenes DSM 20306 TaxID=649754 RepID=A0ABN0ABX4_CORAM|nr:hypothetical protein [Corynebacterium ammoniagenes]APT82180.1 hypothetical protein CAMM_04350 [Corynebacterium ammoniagenes DSM 20306]AQS73275.1 hypothetical protein CA40472_04675 [Corynebacterium ammoniagenes]EFG80259.1 hypothetical protein HMPREF0281_02352 [Corynebacterium ammoniagenes DSM 20306]
MQELFRAADFASFQLSEGASSITQRPSAQALGSYRISRISGLAVGESFAIESILPTILHQPLLISDFHDALGEWMAIGESKSANGSEYLVFGDTAGYCPVFYAQLNDRIVVADTFMGAIHGMKYFGAVPELDFAHYVATLFPAHPHFDNPSVHRTMSADVRILGIDEALHICESGMEIINRSALSQSKKYNYKELLERGSQLVRGAIEQLNKVEGLQKSISLSGGVDSRLVLSLITSSGFVDEFRVSSVDPRTWRNQSTRDVVERDIAIADAIRNSLNLEWSTVGEREFLQFDFRDSLNFHQSYKSNFSHSFSAPPGHTVHSDLKITFRGGGGELLRTTLTGEKIASQIDGRPCTLSEELRFVDWYISKLPILKHEHPLIQEYMTDTFKSAPGKSMLEKLNELYRRTRNRTHFGHVRQSGSTNNYAFHPLSNHYFTQASELLGLEKRKDGKIVRDLYNLNDPTLLAFPFENDDSTRIIANDTARDVQLSDSSWKAQMDKLKSTRSSSTPRQGWSADERLVTAPFNKIEAATLFTAQSMKLLEDFTGFEQQKAVRRINSRAFEQARGNVSKALSLSTKVASALDVFMPSLPPGNHIELFTSDPESDFGTTISKVRIEFPVRVQDGWHNQPIPEFIPTMSALNGIATVTLDLSQRPSPLGEFAVYFYKNNRRIDKAWYSKETEFTFSLDGPGSYFAQVFYRPNDSHRTSHGLKTNEILID